MSSGRLTIATDERGQITLFFAISLFVLILFTGLAIDGGLLYVTKAKLSASVDAACLDGMNALPQGQSTATTVATDIFNANYGSNPPTPSVAFPLDAHNNQQVKVSATANVHTLFMQVVPAFATVPVSATAVATRAKLIMSLVLDRSGSMCGGTVPCLHGESGDNGAQALKAAVPAFVNNFDDTLNSGDEVGLVSFSSNANIDYPVGYGFKTPIGQKVGNMVFEGATFGTGAGTGQVLDSQHGPPISLAGLQNDGIAIPSGQNVVKVVVYFTDGKMNTIQEKLHCGGKGNSNLSLLNFGGFDNPTSGTYACMIDPTQSFNFFGTANSTTVPYTANGGTCSQAGNACTDGNGNKVTKFTSQQPGKGAEDFHQTNVTQEAAYRAQQTASKLRSESPPNYIYTIGLGSSIDSSTQMLLKEIANDPGADTYTTSQATGEFFYIKDCPSNPASICNNEVLQVFQKIAAKVKLRLTQ